jgi:hypothetical protein
MARSKQPEINSMSAGEFEGLLAQLQSGLPPELFLKVQGLLQTLQWLMGVIEQKTYSLGRLRRLLFGSKTEKASNLFGGGRSKGKNPKGTRRKGHGRKPAKAYPGAKVLPIAHEDGLCAGALCSKCLKGKLRELTPMRLIRIAAQPMITALIHEMQRLRCALCGAVFTARAPAEAAQGKYDSSVGVMLAISRYGMGVPMYRTAKWQEHFGVPLAASTQWELIESVVKAPQAVYEALEVHAGSGQLIHSDDTTMRIQELARQREQADADDNSGKDKRTGCFTTGIVAQVAGRQVALFVTGARHAGENLDEVLKHRPQHLERPLHMSDGLSRNESKEFQTILCNCLAHARRNLVDITENFPEECQYIIESLGKVYRHDAQAKELGLGDLDRLAFHREHSQPVMEELKKWMDERMDQKKVEPNSGLGQAIEYMRKRWDRLTRFLSVPGAPLDNNIVERALKTAILHRKNSMSYKTFRGAKVGDVFMSLIHTCALNRINPFDYLRALHRNAEAARAAPSEWFPWNHQQALAALKPPDPPNTS